MRRMFIGLLALASLVAAGCHGDPPAPRQGYHLQAPFIVGCVDMPLELCGAVVTALEAAMPASRRPIVAVVVRLGGCANVGSDDELDSCPATLEARTGATAVADLGDGGEPIAFNVDGPTTEPVVRVVDDPCRGSPCWTESLLPRSPRVSGPGPFPFQVGHCGLEHVVDFDGSFWAITGEVHGVVSGDQTPARGQMSFRESEVVEYSEPGFSAQLTRFPGPRFFRLCA